MRLGDPCPRAVVEAVGNPNVVAGGTYQLEQPVSGPRAAFMLSANVGGLKLGSLPLYVGGVGVALPTSVESVAAQFGNFVQLTIPAVTWYPCGQQDGDIPAQGSDSGRILLHHEQ